MTAPPAHGPLHRGRPGDGADVMGIPQTLRKTPDGSIGSPPNSLFCMIMFPLRFLVLKPRQADALAGDALATVHDGSVDRLPLVFGQGWQQVRVHVGPSWGPELSETIIKIFGKRPRGRIDQMRVQLADNQSDNVRVTEICSSGGRGVLGYLQGAVFVKVVVQTVTIVSCNPDGPIPRWQPLNPHPA
jgi:hypothetical protein